MASQLRGSWTTSDHLAEIALRVAICRSDWHLKCIDHHGG